MKLYTAIFATMFVTFAMPPPALHAQSQQEMNLQSEADFEKADAKLNLVYKKLFSTLDDTGKQKLKAAQKAWLVYRNAEAAYQSDSAARGGSMAPMIYSGTEATLTKQRIKELQTN